MNIRKMITAFCLAGGLAIAAPALAPTLGISQPMATVLADGGWKQDANGVYYLENGTKVTGWKTIGDGTYYFNASGYRVSGTVLIGGKTYCFRSNNGKLVTGVAGLAQLTSNADVYYYFTDAKDGTVATSSWVTWKNGAGQNCYFYADASGTVRLGTIMVNNQLYHITKNGRLTSYQKSAYDNKYYYATSTGVLKTGLCSIGGKQYYFDPVTGARVSGDVTIDGKTYHFDEETGTTKKGWVNVDGKYYYYNKSGKKLTGQRTLGGKKYYLDPKDNGARATSKWCKIKGKYYYYNKKGVLRTGKFTVGGKTYITTASGARRTGMLTINNRKYYFRKNGSMKTGWFTYKGKKYYFNKTKSASTYGAAKTGFTRINGSWYYFNQDGTMKTGWLLDNMKYYYFHKKTGKMLTGRQKIDGKTYDFGTSGGFKAEIEGAWSIQVNRKSNFVVVYKGNTAVKAFVCSTAADGVSTPTGTFTLLDKLRWHELNGPSWGQYCSHITSDILFHSVPCSRYNDNHSLKADAYNRLGTSASGGCIRLTVKHAKFIYDNCPVGTKVTINDSVARPKGITIETAPKIPLTQNYDPTDPAI